jgi:uncharacterized delta-60 repeat protein
MKRYWPVAFAIAIVVVPATRAAAQAGGPDPTFGTNGRVLTAVAGENLANAVAIQADGRIVAAGQDGFNDFALVRYNPDGSLDTGFGTAGRVVTHLGGSMYASAVRILPSTGKIIAAGTLDFSDFIVVRYNPDGSVDSSFGAGGSVVTDFGGSETLTGMAIQPDGTIVVVGDTFSSLALARYTAGGALDPTFSGDGKLLSGFGAEIHATGIAVQPDGKIVVSGYIFPGTTTDYVLARYNADGTRDTSFGTNGVSIVDFGDDEYAFGMAIQPDGRIVVGGGSGFDFAVARFSATGTPDLTFGVGGQRVTDFGASDLAYSMALQSSGRIVLAGRTRTPGGADRFALARYDSDGAVDLTFGTAGKVVTDFTVPGSPGEASAYSQANGVAVQADGNIVAAGYAWTGETGTDTDFALVRYIGANTSAGSNVVVAVGNAMLTFANVTQAGDTTVTTSSAGPAPPDGFSLGNPATYFEIRTTAIFLGSVGVCIDYTGIAFSVESSLQLLHLEATGWVNATTSLDTVNDVICGSVTSLSPFIIAQPAPVTTIQASVDVTPDVLQTRAKGSFITVYIELPSGSGSPASIDVSSIRLSLPTRPGAVAGAIIAAISDDNLNGVPELAVKFDRAIVQSWFTASTVATLQVEGRLLDGRVFRGQDVIRVMDR